MTARRPNKLSLHPRGKRVRVSAELTCYIDGDGAALPGLDAPSGWAYPVQAGEGPSISQPRDAQGVGVIASR